jgi:hypothetical protein
MGQTISAVGLAAMTNAANLDGVGIWTDEEEAIVANAQPKLFSSLESFHDSAKRCNAERICIAVGLPRLRTSLLAGSVQTIGFTSALETGQSLSS